MAVAARAATTPAVGGVGRTSPQGLQSALQRVMLGSPGPAFDALGLFICNRSHIPRIYSGLAPESVA